jgi:GT2 family glycosyltransferase
MQTDRLFIIIPVLNRWHQTRNCLQHLARGTDRDYSVIVVDHGSTDGTREGLSQEFQDVIRLEGTIDMWWTAATNLGIKAALERGANCLMLLNNDCYFSEDTLKRLRHHADNQDEACIAPVQRSLKTGKPLTYPMTTCFTLGFPILQLPGKPLYNQQQQRLISVQLIIGGRGVLIPAEIFRKHGLLNEEDLPHYGSDLDFYLRCRKQGIPLLVAPDAVVDVDESTTTMSARLGRMSLRDFIRSLKDRRSHRNLRELSRLFRLHYPVRVLYPVGVLLNLTRYSMVYATSRLARIVNH